eukprot:TRINITY_DN6193_c0_g1_i3.p1 TRINITY_DN6193_c0_g1~~TRINITY_DN6193_c0_g1_i3.p1  ORF type:complete len:665 (-),score=76.21 TRINITY_DN6193_c0_g1_i3:251-2131(-)
MKQICQKCVDGEKDPEHEILCTTPLSLALLLLASRRMWFTDSDVEPLQQQLYGLDDWLNRAKNIVSLPEHCQLEWKALWGWLLGIREGADAPCMVTVQLIPNGTEVFMSKACVRLYNVENEYQMHQFDVVGINGGTNEVHFLLPSNHGLSLNEWMIALGDLRTGAQVSQEALLGDPAVQFKIQVLSQELFELSNLYMHSATQVSNNPEWNHIWLEQTEIKPLIFEQQNGYEVDIPLEGLNKQSLTELSSTQKEHLSDKKSKKADKKFKGKKDEGALLDFGKPFLSFPNVLSRGGGVTRSAVIQLSSPEIQIPLELPMPILAHSAQFNYFKKQRKLQMKLQKSEHWPEDGKSGIKINPFSFPVYESPESRLQPALMSQFLEKELEVITERIDDPQAWQKPIGKGQLTPSLLLRNLVQTWFRLVGEFSRSSPLLQVFQMDGNTDGRFDLFVIVHQNVFESSTGLPLLAVCFLDWHEVQRKYGHSSSRLMNIYQQFVHASQQVAGITDKIEGMQVQEDFLNFLKKYLYKNYLLTDQKNISEMGLELGAEFKLSFIEPFYVDGPSVTNIKNFQDKLTSDIMELSEEDFNSHLQAMKENMVERGLSEQFIQEAMECFQEERRKALNQAVAV